MQPSCGRSRSCRSEPIRGGSLSGAPAPQPTAIVNWLTTCTPTDALSRNVCWPGPIQLGEACVAGLRWSRCSATPSRRRSRQQRATTANPHLPKPRRLTPPGDESWHCMRSADGGSPAHSGQREAIAISNGSLGPNEPGARFRRPLMEGSAASFVGALEQRLRS